MRTRRAQQQFLELRDTYRESGRPWPATARAIAEWAIERDIWRPPAGDVINRLSRQIADAMAEEHITDAQGRSVRRNHAAQLRKKDGQFAWVWDTIDKATRSHMEVSLQTRRQAIVGDCKQLKTDADSYNENFNPGEPIQLSLDFTNDVAEAEAVEALTRNVVEPTLCEQPS